MPSKTRQFSREHNLVLWQGLGQFHRLMQGMAWLERRHDAFLPAGSLRRTSGGLKRIGTELLKNAPLDPN